MKITAGLLPGQVLQRVSLKYAKATIHGTVRCDEVLQIRATLLIHAKPVRGWRRRKVGSARNSRFRVYLEKLPIGGPYQLLLEAGQEAATIRDFFVGDVWLLAGQSNMEGLGNIDDTSRPHPLVRVFSMDHHWRLARDPLHLTATSPDPVHRIGLDQKSYRQARKEAMAVGRGAGLGLPFAREMARRTNIPQGLICTAHGGTSMQQWNPAFGNRGGESFYGSLLRSVRATGQPLAGLLWYQGECDANPEAVPLYTERMKALVAASRRDLRQPRLPWLIVQIARHLDPSRPCWNEIQEQQRTLHRHISHLGCVAAVDLPLDDGIHIAGKGHLRLGVRLARLADQMVHKSSREMPPPDLERIGFRQGKYGRQWVITARFRNVSGGLRSQGEPSGFTMVSARNEVIPRIYKSWIEGDTVCLEINRPLDPTEMLVYGHGRMPHANITDARDLAIPVFTAQPILGASAITPWMNRWNLSGIQEGSPGLDKIAAPKSEDFLLTSMTFGWSGFVDRHEDWRGKSGLEFFFGEISCPETMTLEVRMGYDGPFRLWIDGRPFFCDMQGINPCIPDKVCRSLSLKSGPHRIVVGMDLAQGKSWGFFLRFRRLDIKPRGIAQTQRLLPSV